MEWKMPIAPLNVLSVVRTFALTSVVALSGVVVAAEPPALSNPDTTPETQLGPEYRGATEGSGSVSDAGNAVYSIPIKVPPGTAGMQPDLTLMYNSNMPNGQFGFGWFLQGMNSKIVRCASNLSQDGVVRTVKFDSLDRFCLDGQKLKVVAGSYGTSGSEYRTEIDRFLRVTAHGDVAGGPGHFSVEYPNGQTWFYGDSEGSKIEANNRNNVRVWLLNRVQDASGNYMDFSYYENQVEGEYRPEQIRYTGNVHNGMQPNVTVSLVYHTRPDKGVSYRGGGKITDFSKRVARITLAVDGLEAWSYHLGYEYFGVNAATSPTGNHSRLKSVQRCATSTGDGGDCQDPVLIEWLADQNGASFSRHVMTVPSDQDNPSQEFRSGRWHDLNGDGRPDYVHAVQTDSSPSPWLYSGDYEVMLSDQSGYVTELWTTNPHIPPHRKADSIIWADVDGDGRTDMVTPWQTGTQTELIIAFAMPGGFEVETWPGYYNYTDVNDVSAGHFLYDMDGDQLLDLVVRVRDETIEQQFLDCDRMQRTSHTNVYSVKVLLNDGAGFGSPSLWAEGIQNEADLADIDGDGLVDLVEDTGWVHYNNGSGFDPGIFFGVRAELDCRLGFSRKNYFHYDFNNDGLADLYAWNHLFLNKGWKFEAHGNIGLIPVYNFIGDSNRHWYRIQPLGIYPPHNEYTELLMVLNRDDYGGTNTLVGTEGASFLKRFVEIADVDGDGMQEVTAKEVVECGDGRLCETDKLYYWKSNSPAHHLVAKITAGRGVVTEFTYRPLTDHSIYTKGAGAVLPIEDVQDATYVVSRFSRPDGIGGKITVKYSYEGLRRDHGGRGLLGFAKITAENVSANTTTVTEYEQEFPYSGQPKYVAVTRSSDNLLLGATEFSYGSKSTSGSAVTVYVDHQIEREYSLETASLMSTLTTDNVVDDYGNIIRSEVKVVDHKSWLSRKKVTTRSYTHDANRWRIQQLDMVTERYYKLGTHDPSLDKKIAFEYYPATGLLHKTIREQGSGVGLELTATLTYDGWGNITRAEVAGPGVAARLDTKNYDARGQFPVSVKNALDHQVTRSYDARFGRVQSETGPNQQTTLWEYDSFGWQWLESRADGTSIERRRFLDASGVMPESEVYVETKATAAPVSRKFVDLLGRTVRQRTQSFGGYYVNVDTQYDSRGRVGRVSEPYFDGAAPEWNIYQYDQLDRPVAYTAGDSTRSWARAYTDREIAATDAAGQTTKRYVNAWGLVNWVVDQAGTKSAFVYDAAGNRISVVNDYGGALSNAITFTYDRLGRQLTQDDPDQGLHAYTYDAFGQKLTELTPRLSAAGQSVAYSYDLLGRVLTRTEPEGVTTWVYDNAAGGNLGIGKPHSESMAGYRKEYRYGPSDHGRLTSVKTTVDGIDYVSSIAYTPDGKVESETYPSGYQVQSTYNPLGFLERVQEVGGLTVHYQMLETDAAGRRTKEWMGDGSVTSLTYDGQSGRLSSQHAVIDTADIQHFDYSYDSRGSMLARQDRLQSLHEAFTYDSSDRLRTATVSGSPTIYYDFDEIDNLTGKSDLADALEYGHPRAVHALTSVALDGAANLINYDANGNLEGGSNVPAIVWSSYNKPVRLAKAGTVYQFSYGPDRLRYKRIKGTQTTRYINGHYEKVTDGWLWGERHVIRAYGRAILRRDTFIGTPFYKYIHSDHLGSITATTSAAGNVIERFSYDAWGNRRDATDWVSAAPATNEPRGYTGHEHLDDIGLIHMNGRVYSPGLGRMVSPDPLVKEQLRGRDYNRYSYAFNNPLKYFDPTGYLEEVVVTAPAGTVYYDWVGAHGLDQYFAARLIYNLSQIGAGFRGRLQALRDFLRGEYEREQDHEEVAEIDDIEEIEHPQGGDSATEEGDPSMQPEPITDDSLRPGECNAAACRAYLNEPVMSPAGFGWFRPEGHRYVAGRPGNRWVAPEGFIGRRIDDHLPAGHTFAVNHDYFVGYATGTAGLPDSLVNIPSMGLIYYVSLYQEGINVPFRFYDYVFGTDTVPFTHVDP